MPRFRIFCFDVRWRRVDSATIVLPQPSLAEADMLDADFWLDQAMMFRQQADAVHDPSEREELCVLAEICDAVASKIEEHVSGG